MQTKIENIIRQKNEQKNVSLQAFFFLNKETLLREAYRCVMSFPETDLLLTSVTARWDHIL